MKIRFYLHNKPSRTGDHPINMEVRWARHPAALAGDAAAVRLSTGLTCQAAHWNLEKERPTKGPGAGFATKRLNGLAELATDTLDQAVVMNVKVPAAKLKQALSDYVKYNGDLAPALLPEELLPPAPTSPTIAEVVAHWQAQMRGQRSASYLRHMSPLVDTWQVLRPDTRIEELVPVNGRSELVEQWITYLLEDVPRRNCAGEFGLDNNTVGSYIKKLRTLLQFAGVPYAWLKDELTYEIDIEPLEYHEVMQLAEATMPRLQLERARDCFVFNCFTGPRYGNLKALRPGDVRVVKGVPLLEYSQIKGRKKAKVKVALDEVAYAIWQRYNGQLPVHSNTQFNTLIKEAAQIAGLTRPVSVVRQYGTRQTTERGPLWQFITVHVARHTYGTLLLDGGASIVEAQDGLGHSSLQSTRRYAKAREKERHVHTLSAFEKLRTSHTAA